MTEAKYKVEDIIENYVGIKGRIFNVHYSDISNDWVYHIRIEDNVYPNSNLASIKESNVKQNVCSSTNNNSDSLLDNKTKRKRK